MQNRPSFYLKIPGQPGCYPIFRFPNYRADRAARLLTVFEISETGLPDNLVSCCTAFYAEIPGQPGCYPFLENQVTTGRTGNLISGFGRGRQAAIQYSDAFVN
jgi:hypothetical protein